MEALHLRAQKLSFHLMRSSPTFFKSRKIESVCIVVVPVRYSEADINQESSLVTQSLHFLRADIHCGVCYYGRICALPSAFLFSSIILVFLRFSFSGDWASNAEYIDQETVTCRFLWALLGFICVCVLKMFHTQESCLPQPGKCKSFQ